MTMTCTARVGTGRAAAGMRLAARRSATGFTLIELAIVGICIAILAATAIASYEYATIKSRRGEAQSCLTAGAQFMERYYTTHMSYKDAPLPDCAAEVKPHYTIEFSATPTATAFTLSAKPEGRQGDMEKDCGTMTMDQTGRRTPTSNCW